MLVIDYFFKTPSDKGNGFLTLSELTAALRGGKRVDIHRLATDSVKLSRRFKTIVSPRHEPAVYLHGVPARDVETVLAALSGDAHDVSKVQWFDGSSFHNFIADPNEFARSY